MKIWEVRPLILYIKSSIEVYRKQRDPVLGFSVLLGLPWKSSWFPKRSFISVQKTIQKKYPFHCAPILTLLAVNYQALLKLKMAIFSRAAELWGTPREGIVWYVKRVGKIKGKEAGEEVVRIV